MIEKLKNFEERPGLIFNANLIEFSKLPRIDSHLHTSWTDGESSVVEVYNSAIENNLTSVLYSEHSRKTSTDWFSKFAEEVRLLPTERCKAYVGTEVKVETIDGEIDTVPAISDLCDFVMASVHRFIDSNGKTMQFDETNPDEAVEIEFKLSWAALENPNVDILGHMFGMSYRRFKQVPPDDMIRELIARAAQYRVAIEINSHYHPDPLKFLQWCQEYDALVTFGSNAHTLNEVGEIVRLLEREVRNA